MRILFAGGGTLGSVTPLVAAAAAIRVRQPDIELHWCGTTDGPERPLVEAAGLRYHALSSGKLRRYLSWRNFTDLFRIAAGFFQARRLLAELRPDLVVSAGGFVAVPLVWAAASRHVRVHVHQMDIRPGLANRLCAPFAASFTVACEKSVADFPRQRAVWTGNPVRPELFTGDRTEAQRLFGLEPALRTVLVLGGGTGAIGLNELTRKAAPLITPTAQMLHLTGRGKSDPSFAVPRYHQVEFLADEMRHAYAAADLVVTRAGMGVLTELAALGLPCVIVPMPDSHQEDNAKYFAERGAAVFVSEKSTFSKAFAEQVIALLGDPEKRRGLADAIRGLNRRDAADLMAAVMLETAAKGQPVPGR